MLDNLKDGLRSAIKKIVSSSGIDEELIKEEQLDEAQQYGVDFDDNLQQSVLDFFNASKDKGAHVLFSNRDIGDGFWEKRLGNNKMIYIDVTYTAGRRKKTEDGYEAKKAREILMF